MGIVKPDTRHFSMDFFTTEVLTLKGLTTYYVLFFILSLAKIQNAFEMNSMRTVL